MDKRLIQVQRVLNAVLQEAKWDYSYSGNMAVVNINETSLILDAEQLSLIGSFNRELGNKIQQVAQ